MGWPGYVLCGVAAILFIFYGARSDQLDRQGWGFENPVQGRREFDTETSCWRELAYQKDIYELRGIACNQRRVRFWSFK